MMLKCSCCGASLQPDRRDCEYCGSWTALEKPTTSTLSPAQERQLSCLDQAWDVEQERYLITLRDGSRIAPRTSSVVVGGLAFLAFMGVYELGACAAALDQMKTGNPPGWLPWAPFLGLPVLGVLFTVAGVAALVSYYKSALSYRAAEAIYRQERAALTLEPRRHVPGPCLAQASSGSWWRAFAVAERDGLFHIQYAGWSQHWDDWLSRERLRFPDEVD